MITIDKKDVKLEIHRTVEELIKQKAIVNNLQTKINELKAIDDYLEKCWIQSTNNGKYYYRCVKVLDEKCGIFTMFQRIINRESDDEFVIRPELKMGFGDSRLQQIIPQNDYDVVCLAAVEAMNKFMYENKYINVIPDFKPKKKETEHPIYS